MLTYSLLYLAAFAQRVCESTAWISIFFPFYCWVVFHSLERLQFIYPGTCSVTFEFFPVFDQPRAFILPELLACSRAVLTSPPTQCMGVPVFPQPSCCVRSNVWIFVNLLLYPSPPPFTLRQTGQPAALYIGWKLISQPVITNCKNFLRVMREELYPLWASVPSFVKWGDWARKALPSLPAHLSSVSEEIRSDFANVSIPNYGPAVTHLSEHRGTSTAGFVTLFSRGLRFALLEQDFLSL